MNEVLILLALTSLIIDVGIIVYSLRIMKIAKYVKLWKMSWYFFIGALSSIVIRRIFEILMVTNFMLTLTHYSLSVVSAFFFFLFTFTISKVFRHYTGNGESLFRKAFMASHDAVIITRMIDGRINIINRTFTHLIGYTDSECQGKTTIELGIWKEPEERKRMILMLEETGRVKDFRATFVAKDGENIDGLMSASTLDLDEERYILTSVKVVCIRTHDERVGDLKGDVNA